MCFEIKEKINQSEKFVAVDVEHLVKIKKGYAEEKEREGGGEELYRIYEI